MITKSQQQGQLNDRINKFVYHNKKTLRNIKNQANYNSVKQIEPLRSKLNALLVACLMNKVTQRPCFVIQKLAFNQRLTFLIAEPHDDQKITTKVGQQSVTNACLIIDYLDKYMLNFAELDLSKVSCSFDEQQQTWTLITDIPAEA